MEDYSRVKKQGIEVPVHGIIMGIFLAGALILLLIGLVAPGELSAVQQSAIFGAAATCGIIARIAQAAGHHDKLMRELQKR